MTTEGVRDDEREITQRRPQVAVLLSRYGLLVALAGIVLVFGVLEPDLFLRPRNIQTILSERAVLLILTLGMLPSLAAGEYDLSSASTMGLSFVLVGWLNVVHGWPIVPSVAVAISAALLVGLVNAYVIVVLDVASIVATLGMASVMAGIATGIHNLIVTGISEQLVALAR